MVPHVPLAIVDDPCTRALIAAHSRTTRRAKGSRGGEAGRSGSRTSLGAYRCVRRRRGRDRRRPRGALLPAPARRPLGYLRGLRTDRRDRRLRGTHRVAGLEDPALGSSREPRARGVVRRGAAVHPPVRDRLLPHGAGRTEGLHGSAFAYRRAVFHGDDLLDRRVRRHLTRRGRLPARRRRSDDPRSDRPGRGDQDHPRRRATQQGALGGSGRGHSLRRAHPPGEVVPPLWGR